MAISVTKDVTPREVDWGNISKYSKSEVKIVFNIKLERQKQLVRRDEEGRRC
jgi:hypothetical protein